MKVLFVASECAPFVKTGGLADVVGALPRALAAEGVEARVMLPAYGALRPLLEGAERVAAPEGLDGRLPVFARRAEGLDLLLLDSPGLYARQGGPYADAAGADWPDNAWRFAALARAAASLAREGAGGWRPDLVHAHDWQAGLTPAYLRFEGGPPSLITVHNMAFQGRFPGELVEALRLPWSGWRLDGFEYHGGVGFLKAGLVYADRIATVSPTYARELAGAAGMGLEGVIAARRGEVAGIVNGVDLDVWNPGADPHLPAPYSADRAEGKAQARAALCRALGIEPGDGPIFGLVSRLTWQKGCDLLLAALPRLLARGGSLAALGSGEPALEAAFRDAAGAHRSRVGLRLGYDEGLAHLIQAGADALLVPSRFEPCGLTQLYALRYGSPPVAARVGGLADTIVDANEAALSTGAGDGFLFSPVETAALADALDRACDAWGDKALWAGLMRRGMTRDVSWRHSAAAYAALYREIAR